MINYLEEYRRNLQSIEDVTLKSVLEDIPIPKVAKLVKEYRKNNNKFIKSTKHYKLSLSLFLAIIGLSGIKDLEEKTSDQALPDSLTRDQALELALQSFITGGLLGLAGPIPMMEYHMEKFDELRQIPLKANEARHAELRSFKKLAGEVAKKMWEEGSSLKHHKMAKYLVTDYQEDRKHPFMFLPGNPDASPDKIILKVVKKVAKDLGRPDLISGTKKPKKIPKG